MATRRRARTLLLYYLCLCGYVRLGSSGPDWVSHGKVVLECPFTEKSQAVDLDRVTVLWDHDGRTLTEYKAGRIVTSDSKVNMSMEELKVGKASINLYNLSRRGSGRYTCTVQYGNQKVPFQYNVEVTERRIHVQHITSGSRKHFALTQARLTDQQPLSRDVIYNVSCITARPGGNITLDCVSSFSTSLHLEKNTIMWSKDGKIISFQNRTCCGNLYPEIYFEGNLVTLQLSQLTPEHAGKYNCYLKHESKEESYDIILQITEDSACSDFSGHDLPSHGPLQTFRKLQVSLVAGVAALASIVALALYFCYRR